MPITDIQRGGLIRAITIDGRDIVDVDPRDAISVARTLRITEQEALSGEIIRTFHAVTGEPDKVYRHDWQFQFTFDDPVAEDGALEEFEELDAVAGYVTFCVWKPQRARYTLNASQVQIVLPHQRRNAGSVLSGLIYDGQTVNTTTVPVKAWLNDVALTVNYADGPTVTAPSAGEITVAKLPIVSGVQSGFVEARLGDTIAEGDVLEIEFTPVHMVIVRREAIDYLPSQMESHSYVLNEI